MYPGLYRGLKLEPEDLVNYDSLLVGFDGKTVILRGQIRLSVQVGSEVVEVDFIVVDAFPLRLLSWQDLGFMPWGLFLPLCT